MTRWHFIAICIYFFMFAIVIATVTGLGYRSKWNAFQCMLSTLDVAVSSILTVYSRFPDSNFPRK